MPMSFHAQGSPGREYYDPILQMSLIVTHARLERKESDGGAGEEGTYSRKASGIDVRDSEH